MAFSEQLKKARLSSGYTQQQVADAMGISNTTYCGYEIGKRQPDVDKLRLLSRILQTSSDLLLETGFESGSGPLPEKYFLLCEDLRKIANELIEHLYTMQEKGSDSARP